MSAPASTEVALGAQLPTLERRIRLVDMVAYAAATWDWHPLHYDQRYVEGSGLPAPVVDGQALGAYLAQHALAALDPSARIVRMSFRLRAMVFAEDVVRVDGEVTAVDVVDAGTALTVTQRITVGDRVVVEGATTQLVAPR